MRQGFIKEPQYLALRAALPDHLKAVLVVAYDCGNRLGELRKLRSRVDLDAGVIRIEKRQAKGKRPRTTPIWGDMAEREEQYKRRGSGCDLVFHWQGKSIGPHTKGWSKACTAAGPDETKASRPSPQRDPQNEAARDSTAGCYGVL